MVGRVLRCALAVAALILAACGSDPEPAEKAKPVGDVLVGSVAPLAQCADWTEGTRAERLATIDDVQEQVNLRDSAVKTPKLSDATAYRLLDTTCRKPFAASFRLYKLYARAASFAAFADDAAPPSPEPQ
jgi:hypothetical protein